MLKALYVDLDGTLLGPGGSLFSAIGGNFSIDGARALQVCARSEVEVVLFTGRREPGVGQIARLIGQTSYIFELGCGLVLDGELEWLTGDCVPSPQRGTIFAQIAQSGAPQLLLEAFPGLLEYHVPWSDDREVSHLFRGLVPASEASALLAGAGLDWLRLVDNGVMSEDRDAMLANGWGIDVDRAHAYHLIPARASKARAVARHMQNRGYLRDEVIACGDSREDMEAADVVGTFWMMANGLERDPTLEREVSARPGVRVTSERFGAGVYEAVVTTLAEGR